MSESELYKIETLVVNPEGRRELGFMAAMENLALPLFNYLNMLSISQKWLDEIESARLEKLRDMDSKDGDASLIIKESDKRLKIALEKQLFNPSLEISHGFDLKA